TAMFFDSPTSVRIFSLFGRSMLCISELDVMQRSLRRTGEIAVDKPFISGNADGSKFLVRDARHRLAVIDGRTAAVEATFDIPFHNATFLHDGRIAVLRDVPESAVDIYDAGRRVRSVPLAAYATWQIRETRDGSLLVPARLAGKPWE